MKSFIVLGLGRFGISFAKTVIELGHEVLGADFDEEIVKRHVNQLTHIVEADITSEEFLQSVEVIETILDSDKVVIDYKLYEGKNLVLNTTTPHQSERIRFIMDQKPSIMP